MFKNLELTSVQQGGYCDHRRLCLSVCLFAHNFLAKIIQQSQPKLYDIKIKFI